MGLADTMYNPKSGSNMKKGKKNQTDFHGWFAMGLGIMGIIHMWYVVSVFLDMFIFLLSGIGEINIMLSFEIICLSFLISKNLVIPIQNNKSKPCSIQCSTALRVLDY